MGVHNCLKSSAICLLYLRGLCSPSTSSPRKGAGQQHPEAAATTRRTSCESCSSRLRGSRRRVHRKRKLSSKNCKSPCLWLSNFRAKMETCEARPLSVHWQGGGAGDASCFACRPVPVYTRGRSLASIFFNHSSFSSLYFFYSSFLSFLSFFLLPSAIPSSHATAVLLRLLPEATGPILSHQHCSLPSLSFLSCASLFFSSLTLSSLILFSIFFFPLIHFLLLSLP